MANHGSVRETAADMMTAQRVQSNLLSGATVPLETLEYTGTCRQAGAVGGDLYDFIPLTSQRMGLVLADVSGKGVSAALLMASLQAVLRSQCAVGARSLCARLRLANRLFHAWSAPEHYATLFFAEYDDRTGCLNYVNCGHNSPFILRASEAVEWLHATATVLGIMRAWECKAGKVILEPGDLLVIFSDGVIEARDPSGEEFGVRRLVQIVRDHRQSPCRLIMRALANGVSSFSGGGQDDDQSAIIARRLRLTVPANTLADRGREGVEPGLPSGR